MTSTGSNGVDHHRGAIGVLRAISRHPGPAVDDPQTAPGQAGVDAENPHDGPFRG